MTDEIPQHYTHLLDHGFIGLVDHMGSDESIVQAARVSYQGGTRPVSEDRTLIRYLVRHRHSSPLEMAEVVLHCKMPIFVARQWVRHRTSSMNEESARYSVIKDEFYVPAAHDIKKQSTSNKQGRAGKFSQDEALGIAQHMRGNNNANFAVYEGFLDNHDLARELARTVLPLATYTSFFWKANLRNVFHFLSLRLDAHAQMEIRVYAEAMLEIIRPLFPLAVEAWEDYDRYAVTFSRMEMEVLKGAISDADDVFSGNFTRDAQICAERSGMSKREITEFMEKIK